MNLLFLPLDSRPCTYDFPFRLAEECGVNVKRPPLEIMDRYARKSNFEKIAGWLLENGEGCDVAVIAVEQLVYGSLIASRSMDVSQEEAERRLEVIRTLHLRYPGLKIHLANSIMRTTISTLRKEDYVQWRMVAEYSQCIARAEQDEQAAKRVRELETEIQGSVLETFLAARKRNHKMNCQVLKLVADGIAEDVVFLQEDSAVRGFHKKEQTAILELAEKYRICDRVTLHCGTDEAACALIGKSMDAADKNNRKIAVQWLGTEKENFIASYEDRPFTENLTGYMATCRLTEVSVKETDIILAIYIPEGKQRDLFLEEQGACVYGAQVLEAFCRKFENWIQQGKKVFLLDLYCANGGDSAFLSILLKKKLLLKLAGYAGWNTASNALGTVLGEILCLPRMAEKVRLRFLKERLLEDWVYQGIVRREINGELERCGIDSANIGNPVLAEMLLKQYMEENIYTAQILGADEKLEAYFPWPRTFEAGIRVITED